jgi:hypothetical protein
VIAGANDVPRKWRGSRSSSSNLAVPPTAGQSYGSGCGLVVDDDIASLLGGRAIKIGVEGVEAIKRLASRQGLRASCAQMGSRWLDHEGTRRRGQFVDRSTLSLQEEV